METISLTSAIVDCHMTQHNWIQFQNEGHSITWRSADNRSRPFNPNCPSCQARKASHDPQDLQFHAQDQIFCLNLFTPGTDPNNWKETGIQCIRVQAPTREEVIRLMQEAIINEIYSFGRQENAKVFQQSQLDKINLERSQFHIFVTENLGGGENPLYTVVQFVRKALKAAGTALRTDDNQMLPPEWRRDQ